MNGMEYTMKKHIELLGILHLVYSGLALAVAVFCFALMSGIGYLTHDALAMGILGTIGMIVCVLITVLAIRHHRRHRVAEDEIVGEDCCDHRRLPEPAPFSVWYGAGRLHVVGAPERRIAQFACITESVDPEIEIDHP